MEGCFFYCAMCCTTHINEAGDPGGETVQIKKEGGEEWDGYSLSEKYVFVFGFGDSWLFAEGDGRIAAMATRCEEGESALAVRASVLKRTLLRHSVFTECVP